MIRMTVVGDEIIQNCANCYSNKGLSSKLKKEGDEWVCEYNKAHRYKIENGNLIRIGEKQKK